MWSFVSKLFHIPSMPTVSVPAIKWPILAAVVLVTFAGARTVRAAPASSQQSEDGQFTFTVLHTNDVHARFESSDGNGGPCTKRADRPSPCYGGIARRVTKVNEVRSSTDNVLLLDGGDQFQGTLWFVYYRGQATRYFMDLLEYDAMVLGNHEFDNGVVGLVPFLANVSFPVVSANIDTSKDDRINGLFNRSTIVNIGGKKIGVVGYTTKDTPVLVKPDDLHNLIFRDEIEAVREEVQRLQREGINIIVALGHAGYPMDKEVAAKVDGVDLVVGGHSNTFLYTGTPPTKDIPAGEYPTMVTGPSGRQVPVVQAYAYGKFLGALNLTFDADGNLIRAWGNPILLDESVEEDPPTLKMVESWREPMNNISKTQVGTTYVYLEGHRDVCRVQECNLGNAMTDAMLLRAMRTPEGSSWTDTSIAFWNSGGIRSSIDQGDFTLEDVLSVFPFRNTISRITMTGRDLKKVFEWSVHAYNKEAPPGGFLQVSGVRVTYDLSRAPGGRVRSLLVRCANCSIPAMHAVDPDKVYGILTSDFLIGGGDGFTDVMEGIIDEQPLQLLDSETFISYSVSRSPLTQGLEGRIIFDDSTSPVTCGTDSVHIPNLMLLSFLFIAIYFSKRVSL